MKNIKNFIKDVIEFLNGFKNMISDLSTKGKRIKQIPNLLTLSRVGFALIIPPLAISGNLVTAAILTIGAALTDAVDGHVARKLNAVSEFGKNLDPVCDKIFAGLLLLPLIGNVSPLLSLGLCANVALEVGIAGVNLKSKAKENVPRTSILGKIKTGFLSALIASLYVSFSYQAMASIIPFIYTLATGIQVGTLIDYHLIDKKKDAEKNKFVATTAPIDTKDSEKESHTKQISKGTVEHFIAREKSKKDTPKIQTSDYNQNIYSSDDYRRLKAEIIRTTITPDNNIDEQEKSNTKQKTK